MITIDKPHNEMNAKNNKIAFIKEHHNLLKTNGNTNIIQTLTFCKKSDRFPRKLSCYLLF